MQISKKLDSLRTYFCVVVKLSNVHEKYTKKKKYVNSSQTKITNFHLLNIKVCFYHSRKMSLVHNSFLSSDLKIIPSLATYAVCTLAVYCY